MLLKSRNCLTQSGGISVGQIYENLQVKKKGIEVRLSLLCLTTFFLVVSRTFLMFSLMGDEWTPILAVIHQLHILEGNHRKGSRKRDSRYSPTFIWPRSKKKLRNHPGSPRPNKEYQRMVFRVIHEKDSRSYQWAKFGRLGLPGYTQQHHFLMISRTLWNVLNDNQIRADFRKKLAVPTCDIDPLAWVYKAFFFGFVTPKWNPG